MLPEFVAENREGKYVEGPPDQDEYDAPDDERRLPPQRKAEEGQSEVGEHARLRDEGDGAHGLLHGDLSDGREVVVGVLTHDDGAEEDGHDAGEVDPLGQGVGRVDEAEHERELERGVVVEVDVLEDEGAAEADEGPDGGRAKKYPEEAADAVSELAQCRHIGHCRRVCIQIAAVNDFATF